MNEAKTSAGMMDIILKNLNIQNHRFLVVNAGFIYLNLLFPMDSAKEIKQAWVLLGSGNRSVLNPDL
ncbi:hypothetical protein KKI24_25605 [bacterium]|nr:hypothetical protein [bacterium]